MPTNLDPHRLQKQGISGFSRTTVNIVEADNYENANDADREWYLCRSCLLKQVQQKLS